MHRSPSSAIDGESLPRGLFTSADIKKKLEVCHVYLLGVLNEGLIYALMALGRLHHLYHPGLPDLSVDSTFSMGAAVTATLIWQGNAAGSHLFIAFGAGALAGTVTGLIHVKLKVRDLLLRELSS